MSKFSTIILRERLPDAMNRPTGWLILGRDALQPEQREIVAILSHSIGLELARQYALLLAQNSGASQILEELKQPVVQDSQGIAYEIILQQPIEG